MDFVGISFKGLGDHQYCRWSITSAGPISATQKRTVCGLWNGTQEHLQPQASSQEESKSEDFEAVFFSNCQHSV